MPTRIDGYRVTKKNGRVSQTQFIEFVKVCATKDQVDWERKNLIETYRNHYKSTPDVKVMVDLVTTAI